MVVHSASRFMQRIGKKQTRLQFQHTNYGCLMLTGQNMCIQPSLTLKYSSEVYEITCFPYGQLPSVDVDKHHDGCPSK